MDGLTHLLLAALVARSLDARLALLVIVEVVIVDKTSRTTLQSGHARAPLALRYAAVSRAHRARWAHGRRPTSGQDRGAVHATAEAAAQDSESGVGGSGAITAWG